ncbi:MAG: hypothetical protein HF978_08060 [Desulfobacteraceae bacterium]|nr:hypothetical protein [Desulfobacteraceae bacterium]MBC2755483.1 hypothetical protein [Desulfobacteraceae bacterium]
MTNKGSSDKINYLVRPAKQVERKLIIEALQCLSKTYDIPKYTYIGMGSRYFVDFQMVHKFLRISEMISFEKEEDKIKRFEFNKPYSFIDIQPGFSTDILPSLPWTNDYFIWLDYDYKISSSIIDDIKIVCDNARPGVILLLTIDAEPKKFDDGFPEDEMQRMNVRLANLKEEIHPHYPPDIKTSDMSKKKFPKILLKIISEIIRDCLRFRDLNFYQIFNFIYEDTSQMYTYGCIFGKSKKKISDTGIYDLKYISSDDTFVKIKLPILTPREKMHFDSLIPQIDKKLDEFEIAPEKLKAYEQYYRYYPQYFESFI